MRDKVDERNKDKKLRSNLIKWWNVNLISGLDNMEEITETVRIAKVEKNDDGLQQELTADSLKPNETETFYNQGLEEDERELLKLIMDKNERPDAYEDAMEEINQSQLKEANEIYQRLLKEQAEDEAKKQDEIEAAKLAARNAGY